MNILYSCNREESVNKIHLTCFGSCVKICIFSSVLKFELREYYPVIIYSKYLMKISMKYERKLCY